jgi:hypothetical protein
MFLFPLLTSSLLLFRLFRLALELLAQLAQARSTLESQKSPSPLF